MSEPHQDVNELYLKQNPEARDLVQAVNDENMTVVLRILERRTADPDRIYVGGYPLVNLAFITGRMQIFAAMAYFGAKMDKRNYWGDTIYKQLADASYFKGAFDSVAKMGQKPLNKGEEKVVPLRVVPVDSNKGPIDPNDGLS